MHTLINNESKDGADGFIDWLEDFVKQLDRPLPEMVSDVCDNYWRHGAWETQQLIFKKLKYAIEAYRAKNT